MKARLADFVGRAGADGMAALAEIFERHSRQPRATTLAIVGATLIDGTGAAPFPTRPSSSKTDASSLPVRAQKSKSRQTPTWSMRTARPFCPACGTCTPTSSRWSGDRFISRPASPRCAIGQRIGVHHRGARRGRARPRPGPAPAAGRGCGRHRASGNWACSASTLRSRRGHGSTATTMPAFSR